MHFYTFLLSAAVLAATVISPAHAQQPAPPTTQELREKLRDQIGRNRAERTGKGFNPSGPQGKSLNDYRRPSYGQQEEILDQREQMREEIQQQQEERRQMFEDTQQQRQQMRDETLEQREGLHDHLRDHQREMREQQMQAREACREAADRDACVRAMLTPIKKD